MTFWFERHFLCSHHFIRPATALSTFTSLSRTRGRKIAANHEPSQSCHLHTQPSFCRVSCFRRRRAPSPARKAPLCCDTLREMCHRVADRKWMVSQTHRQLTGTEDSSKCGGDVVTAAAWWQPAGSDAAMLAEGPTDTGAGTRSRFRC